MAKKKTTKKSTRRKPSKAKARDEVILALVAGEPFGEVAERVAAKLGLDLVEARAVVGELRQAIVVAAGTDRVGELRNAIDRLDDLYCDALNNGGESAAAKNVALGVLKERARLLGLHHVSADPDAEREGGASAAEQELESIGGHLLPLGLAKPDLPLVEHARIAADAIRRSRA
ncbi:MAG: hypothetical protein AAGG38_09225 [Planctomycetota bacterium]